MHFQIHARLESLEVTTTIERCLTSMKFVNWIKSNIWKNIVNIGATLKRSVKSVLESIEVTTSRARCYTSMKTESELAAGLLPSLCPLQAFVVTSVHNPLSSSATTVGHIFICSFTSQCAFAERIRLCFLIFNIQMFHSWFTTLAFKRFPDW